MMSDAISSAVVQTNETVHTSVADELIKLKGLLDSGVLSQEEFEKLKERAME